MKEKWEQLSERDRIVLLIGGLILGLFLLYLMVFSPLTNGIEALKTETTYQTSLLSWMKEAQTKLKPQADVSQKHLSTDQLLGTLSTELKRLKLTAFPYQIQQTASGKVRLNFKRVPFDSLISWLTRLKQHYRLNIEQFSASKLKQSGLTKSELIFSVQK